MNIPSELADLGAVDLHQSFRAISAERGYPECAGRYWQREARSNPGGLLVLVHGQQQAECPEAGRRTSPTSTTSGFARLTSGNVCPRGQPDTDPPSTDEVPPTFEMAELSRDGLTIVLTYNESLDSSNGPATTDFTVKVDGQAVSVSTVDVRIREVRLALGARGDGSTRRVTVAYKDPTIGQ